MTGRKPKATAIKILEAPRAEAARLERRRISTPSGPIEAPEWLTEHQKARFGFYVANAPANVLKNVDTGTLAVYVVAEDEHKRATVESRTAATSAIRAAQVRLQERAANIMFRAASELGFTPCSRAKLEAATPPAAAEGWEDVA